MTLIIEAGKFYKTRDGRKVGPMVDCKPYFSAEGVRDSYHDNGRQWKSCESPLDLISEWPELTPHQKRTAEMMEVMQAYVDGAEVQSNACGSYFAAGLPVWNWAMYDYRVAPATTPDTIDWSHVAPDFKWMARDRNSTVWLYAKEPEMRGELWVSSGLPTRADIFTSYRRGTCDWKESPVKRPE